VAAGMFSIGSMPVRGLVTAWILLLGTTGLAQKPAEAPIPAEVAAFETALVGRWSGVLEYRDYKTEARTKLPTWASISLTHTGMAWQYVYDDGPNKQVKEDLVVTLTPETYTAVNLEKPKETVSAQVAGLGALKNGRGTVILTGAGMENGHTVAMRTTMTLGRNLLEITKETKGAGEEFRFRDGYTLTRLTPLYETAAAR
jgi:hypothetical protein